MDYGILLPVSLTSKNQAKDKKQLQNLVLFDRLKGSH